MKLHWALGSQPGRAVKTVVDIGKIPCTLVTVDILQRQQRSKEYLKMYPAGKIPVLQDGDFTLAESGAIMTYLCERYPSVHYLTGRTVEQRATINQFVSWYQSYFRPAFFRPVRLYLGALFSQKPIPRFQRDALFAEMLEALAVLDKILSNSKGRFLAGDELSIADLLVFYEVTNLVYFGLDHKQYSSVDRWFKEVYGVPEVKSITHEWYQVGKGMAEMFESIEIANPKL